VKKLQIAALAVWAAALAGCSGSHVPSLTGSEPASSSAAPAYDPATATARVFGSIKLEGKPPVMAALQPGGSRYCVMNARGMTEQDVLVTKDGKLRNVIVYVRSGFEGRTYTAPDEPRVLDQQRCLYVPHVFTIMTNQKLTVRNSDSTFHNVHAVAQTNSGFNFAQTVKGSENQVKFDHAEMPFRIGCDLHRWMGAWVGVFDHPFHSTSGDSGNYELKLPPGKYEIAAWQEKYGEKVSTIEVRDNAEQHLDFSFAAQ
jgi:plastocyanin